MNQDMKGKDNFNWQRFPVAWQWVMAMLEDFRGANREIDALARQLFLGAGVRLMDIAGPMVLSRSKCTDVQLEDYGYSRVRGPHPPSAPWAADLWTHHGGMLPDIGITDGSMPTGLAVKVESIAQFLMVRGLDLPIEGHPLARFRCCTISNQNNAALWLTEQRGTAHAGKPNSGLPDRYLDIYLRTLERWMNRPRHGENGEIPMQQLMELARLQVGAAGLELAAHLFFEAERLYWCSRNEDAGALKHRLDSLGTGWSNHDHHTYRSSREHFHRLPDFFRTLGFHSRESFYAGAEAGWGALVMENPQIGVTLFLDVDLFPREVDAHLGKTPLPTAPVAGSTDENQSNTVGLWCALHGDSLFGAGLHHLAVRADFQRLKDVMNTLHTKTMAPFSDLPYLKQAFTRGRMWPVDASRIEKCLEKKWITPQQAEKFATHGALGSHMENIQRDDGFKGFNSKNISDIIRRTNPRK